VFPDHIVCLEDGKKLKMLKRHLQASYGMTPRQYREKWGLPADYPMVAPNYASHRSSLAKQNGLGRKPASTASERMNLPDKIEELDLPVQPTVTQGRARRARGSKG
jgi:predicted transcriptional regulator